MSHFAIAVIAIAIPVLLIVGLVYMSLVVMPGKARRLKAQEAYLRAHSEERSTGWALVRKSAPWLFLGVVMLTVGIVFHVTILILGGVLGFVGHGFDQWRSAQKKREGR